LEGRCWETGHDAETAHGFFPFLLLATTSAALAHAFLDHAEPAVGSKVHGSLVQVKIWFTEKLESALSKIQVFDSSNQEVDQRDVQTDKSNAALLTVSLRALKPGNYKVVWRAVSVDTHVTTGNYTFEVVP
jgi:methionine-rich copper-binding protein CopC